MAIQYTGAADSWRQWLEVEVLRHLAASPNRPASPEAAADIAKAIVDPARLLETSDDGSNIHFDMNAGDIATAVGDHAKSHAFRFAPDAQQRDGDKKAADEKRDPVNWREKIITFGQFKDLKLGSLTPDQRHAYADELEAAKRPRSSMEVAPKPWAEMTSFEKLDAANGTPRTVKG